MISTVTQSGMHPVTVFVSPAALSSPLQILAAQASSSPPVLVSRLASAGSDGGLAEPQAKRVKMEEDLDPPPQPVVAPAQQPVIVSMISQLHDPRK